MNNNNNVRPLANTYSEAMEQLEAAIAQLETDPSNTELFEKATELKRLATYFLQKEKQEILDICAKNGVDPKDVGMNDE